MPVPRAITEILERHLAAGAGERSGLSGEEPERYLKAMGLDPGEVGMPEEMVLGTLEEANRAGVDAGAQFAIAQAYGRGIGRIAAAEAEIVRRLVRQAPPGARVTALDDLLSRTLPLAARLLQAIHRARLWKELEDTLDEEALNEDDTADRTIALVDLVSSTRFLADAGPEDTEQMVDAIHEVGQECTAGRAVTPIKFVGDGVFLLGRDPREVTSVTLNAVHSLDRGELPLRARAGLAGGPVVRRAGDYFGLTVNLTQRLVQAAPVGAVLAECRAVRTLPPDILREEMTKELRGIPGATECVALRRKDGEMRAAER